MMPQAANDDGPGIARARWAVWIITALALVVLGAVVWLLR
jgi:hypothetical protein